MTLRWESVSKKLPRLRVDFVERLRRILEELSPPRRPPRQNMTVAKKKQATAAHVNPIR